MNWMRILQEPARAFALKAIPLLLVLAAPHPSAAQTLMDAPLAKAVWTAEAIRSVRAIRDYDALVDLLLTEASVRANTFHSPEALKQALARANAAMNSARAATDDPDLNPAVLRARLVQLRNSGAVPNKLLDPLIAALTRSKQVSLEASLLRIDDTETKAVFNRFLQAHLASLYDQANDNRASAVLSAQIGAVSLPDPKATAAALIAHSHLPEGQVKAVLSAISTSGSVDVTGLSNAATNALAQTTKDFDSARRALTSIVQQQPRLDTIFPAGVPAKVQPYVDLSNRLASTSIDQLEQFDVLETVVTVLPLPNGARKTIATVAELGSSVQSTVSTVSQVAKSVSSLSSLAGLGMDFLTTGGLGSLAGSFGSVFGGGGPSNQDVLNAVNQVSQEVQEMHHDMDLRFDEVDQQLGLINRKLDAGFTGLSDQVKQTQITLNELVSTAQNIEQLTINQNLTFRRMIVNNLCDQNDKGLKEVHRNLVRLTHDVQLDEQGFQAMTREEFKTLAEYFSTLASSESNSPPLNGLQLLEAFDFETVEARLGSASCVYPVNYAMSFPIGGAVLQNLLPGSEAARDLQGNSYPNERVWALASNALALMSERWPSLSYEIPGERDGWDQVTSTGQGLLDLVKALQMPGGSGLSAPAVISAASDLYLSHAHALIAALDEALGDEAAAYGKNVKGVSDVNAAALRASFAASSIQNATAQEIKDTRDAVSGVAKQLGFGDRRIQALVEGLDSTKPGKVLIDSMHWGRFAALGSVDVRTEDMDVSGCNGLDVKHRVPGGQKLTPDVAAAIALGNAELSACIADDQFVDLHSVTENHGGYRVRLKRTGRDLGNMCDANSKVTLAKVTVKVTYFLRLRSDPDDAAHRIIIGSLIAKGPDTEISEEIIGNVHWSGQADLGGNNWNAMCPQAWKPGNVVALYVGSKAYIDANWNAIAGKLAPENLMGAPAPLGSGKSSGYPGTMASADLDKMTSTLKAKSERDLSLVYKTFAHDFVDLLFNNGASTSGGTSIEGSTKAKIEKESKALDGTLALLRVLTSTAFEETLRRDDVLSGLLFGSSSSLGTAGISTAVNACIVEDTFASSPDFDLCFGSDIVAPLEYRPKRFLDRVTLISQQIAPGKLIDSHIVVEKTLERLRLDRCLLPGAPGDNASCATVH